MNFFQRLMNRLFKRKSSGMRTREASIEEIFELDSPAKTRKPRRKSNIRTNEATIEELFDLIDKRDEIDVFTDEDPAVNLDDQDLVQDDLNLFAEYLEYRKIILEYMENTSDNPLTTAQWERYKEIEGTGNFLQDRVLQNWTTEQLEAWIFENNYDFWQI